MEPVLTQNMLSGAEYPWIDIYEKNGGYAGYRKAVTGMSPAEVISLVKDSNLRGRGGAGFPTGMKWSLTAEIETSSRPRYLCCNFDEMEPGTFKDRFLAEGDPHQLIEGLLIASYAIQADVAYIFVRAEYHGVVNALDRALAEARDKGYIGTNVFGKGWDIEVSIHASAGRYMCGEETGLLNALEGRRANPRSKPPFPGTSGLFGKPTVVNNVETLCCVPHIINRGAEWFMGLGKAKDAGMKIYGVSGRVNRPGAFELPIGTTLGELINEHAGGMSDGYSFRAALPGGASTQFLSADRLNIPLEFTSLKEIGCFMGTGTAIVLDDRSCPVGMSLNIQEFFARESCGWCTPCREGIPWLRDLLADIEEGRAELGDIEILSEQCRLIGPNTYCAFAMGAVQPLMSGIELFRSDFEEHIRDKRCSYRSGS